MTAAPNPPRLALLVVLAVWACVVTVAAIDVPYLSGRVVDEANIITPAARERLTAAMKAHEDATTNQIAVLTVQTIQPE
ncbi:MAG TPA: TPM domain-containing protein, partial [Vicinamibacterales bacterium]|nr:TPM domain-containing protein [Vicinamibacterales bacterium]